MNGLSPFFAVIIYLIAFITGYLINLKYKVTTTNTRYETIDGFRGFLALGVFIYHASMWKQYIQIGKWDPPQSNFYCQFGGTSVAFFFMITSFLFISKLINSTEKGFNWRAFFISRIFRIMPMYYFSVFIIILLVMINSHWELKESMVDFLKSIFNWVIFTIHRSARINNYNLTLNINAGVQWSLPLEWLFYFSLPLISLFILKRKPSGIYLLISVLFIFGYFLIQPNNIYHNVISFMSGAIAPFILKYAPKIKVNNFLGSVVLLACLILIGGVRIDSDLIYKLLVALIFTLIALGNTLFGVLKNSTLKLLGEICYSTYLLHGIILFTVLYVGFGMEKLKPFTSLEYWCLIFLITPLVVIISFLGYKFIEKPFMDKAKKINESLNSNK
ncbi:MAG TPA: acyltransferase [Bacteroidia bacterium]|nr:acyltransferase [Bacteroidia bacterium]